MNLASDGATGNSALLYSMKEEIECLRSELDKARETAPPNSATTILTVDSSEVTLYTEYYAYIHVHAIMNIIYMYMYMLL